MNQVRHDNKRDERWVTLYNDDALELMSGWTGGQDDPLYAISSSGGANYAWVFADAITNLSSDIAGVKKVGKKYQLGKGTFTKKEIDELHIIHDALVAALEETPADAPGVNPHAHRKTRRYIGDAVVEIEYVGQSSDNRSEYKGVILVGPHKHPFDELRSGVGRPGDTPEAFDEMAASAIGFASYYTSDNRDEGEDDDTPTWAPSPEIADAISEATSFAQNDQGSYDVRRTPEGKGRYVGEARRPRGGWWIHWSNGSENGPFDSRGEAKHYADYWKSEAQRTGPHSAKPFTFKIDQVSGHDERTGPRPMTALATSLPQRGHIVMRDFTTLPEIIAHAQKEGATHVITGGVHNRIRVYFPHSGQYEEAILWRDGGYWHSPAPSHRAIIVDLPPGAEPIEAYLARSGGQMTERHVRDYIAVDPGGRPVAGPFKDYSEAKKHADRARGHVEFKMGEAVRSSGSRMIRGFHVVDPQGVTLHFDQGYAFPTEAAARAAIESEIASGQRSELRIEPCEWSEFSIENWQQRGFKTREAARGKRAPMTWTRQNTKLSTWFERDRAHVDLQTLDDQTIIEWWDEAVAEAVEDGFLNPRDWHGSAVEYANYIGAQAPRAARGSKTREAARKKRAPNNEEIGAQYAQDQVASDYFMDWVRGQIVEAEEMGRREPGSVFPLGTKAAYRKLARNMLQQLEWDTKRQMDTREIHALGASDSKSFFIGFVEELKADNTLNWLADEIETIHKQSVGPEVDEMSVRASKAYFGEAERNGYAIKIDGIENDFPQLPPGRQVDAQKAVQQFKSTAKSDWISTKRRKGQRPLAEIKRWIKAVQPDQFYARWRTDVDDDSVQIWYTGGQIGVMPMSEAPLPILPGAPAPLLLPPGPTRRTRRPPPRAPSVRRRVR